MAAETSCHACGKSECKLLRCGRCRTVWFCNRECQVVATRQGHSGANCRPADEAPTRTEAEVAPRMPDAAGPSTAEPGVNSAALAPAANTCHACGKSVGKLLLCGRCKSAWFCNRECQIVTRKELGHKGANCRPADGAQSSPSSQPSTSIEMAKLCQSFVDLIDEAEKAQMANTRIGYLAAVEKFKEAAAVADRIGGAQGVSLRANVDQALSGCLFYSGDKDGAARAACSSVRAARASGSRTMLVAALSKCGVMARAAPSETASSERESREQERLSGSPSSYGTDLSQEGWVSLPTTPAALSRLGLAYNEAAVAICDAALAAAGGRGSPAATDDRQVPSLHVEAQARGSLGTCLCDMGEEQQRSLELMQQAVALWRQLVRKAASGHDTLDAQGMLADQLSNLGFLHWEQGSEGMVEAEACLREALALGEGLGDVWLTVKILKCLINLCGEAHAPVGPAEAEALRSRLNQLLVQMGRSPETSCSICLEPLAPTADGAAEGAAGDGGSADGLSDSFVRVMHCNHQFHHCCLSTWERTTSNYACPLCKK